jgi:hypothetical protein
MWQLAGLRAAAGSSTSTNGQPGTAVATAAFCSSWSSLSIGGREVHREVHNHRRTSGFILLYIFYWDVEDNGLQEMVLADWLLSLYKSLKDMAPTMHTSRGMLV